MKLFQRALQYNDQKKLYMAMLGIMLRAGHSTVVDELLKAMCRRFGTSAKVGTSGTRG
jgi:rRNA biogenesis protein RRP5